MFWCPVLCLCGPTSEYLSRPANDSTVWMIDIARVYVGVPVEWMPPSDATDAAEQAVRVFLSLTYWQPMVTFRWKQLTRGLAFLWRPILAGSVSWQRPSNAHILYYPTTVTSAYCITEIIVQVQIRTGKFPALFTHSSAWIIVHKFHVARFSTKTQRPPEEKHKQKWEFTTVVLGLLDVCYKEME